MSSHYYRYSSPQPSYEGQLRFVCVDLPYVAVAESRGEGADFEPCEIEFRDLKGEHISAAAALARTLPSMGCYALARGSRCPLPSDVPPTISLVYHFPGHKPIVRDISPWTNHGELMTLNVLAYIVALEMRTAIDLEREAGNPLRHNGVVIQFDKLVMKRLFRVSERLWQPEFKFWC